MTVRIEKVTLPYKEQNTIIKVNAFVFLPTKKRVNGISLFTHGYTSLKSSILNWSLRLAEEGVAGVLFDLPGHYLGSFTEVSDFENFKSEAPQLFIRALEALRKTDSTIDPNSTKLIIGGHSLGALLSLKAISLSELQEFHQRQVCAVGFGLPPQGVTHIFDTPFYKSTLAIRGQLVSPAIRPDIMFPWIKEEKEALSLSGESIYLLTGEDDVVVGKDGVERLKDQLESLGNQVTLEKPSKLAHHLPESAAPHLKKWLKDQGFFQN